MKRSIYTIFAYLFYKWNRFVRRFRAVFCDGGEGQPAVTTETEKW